MTSEDERSEQAYPTRRQLREQREAERRRSQKLDDGIKFPPPKSHRDQLENSGPLEDSDQLGHGDQSEQRGRLEPVQSEARSMARESRPADSERLEGAPESERVEPEQVGSGLAATDGQDDAEDAHQGKKRRDKPKRHPVQAFFIECATIIVAALIISFVVKTFFMRAFYIPSESMEPTLEVGDRIVVNLLAPGPMELHRGDVVVFEDTSDWWADQAPETNAFQDAMIFVGLMPDTSSHFVVKRIVGLEGDQVECCDDQGRIMVNGAPIDEPYIQPGDAPSEMEFDVVVPEDSVWLLGDHRSNSADSRSQAGQPDAGAVPLDDVIGRSVATVWPFDRWSGGGKEREAFDHVPDQRPQEEASAGEIGAGAQD